jgi:hypothetical protein
MQSTVEVTDLFRGAFLLASGCDLSEIRIAAGSRPIAAFLITGQDLDKLDRAYRCGQALVNPLQLREALNHLRDLLFERLRENEGRTRDDRRAKNRAHQYSYRP